MDVSDFLKLGLKDLCKPKQSNRVVQIRQLRQQNRDKYMMSQRHIVPSTEITPEVRETKRMPLKKQVRIAEVVQPQRDTRREALLAWRAEKAKKDKDKQDKSKPLFKVSKVVAPTKLEDIYPHKAANQQAPSFAGSTHKFKPPKNIKPIAIHQTTVAQNTRSKTGTMPKPVNDTASKKTTKNHVTTTRTKNTKGKTQSKGDLVKNNDLEEFLKVSNAINTIPKITKTPEREPSTTPKKMGKTPNKGSKKKNRRDRENMELDVGSPKQLLHVTPKHANKKRNTDSTPRQENGQTDITPEQNLSNNTNAVVYVSPFVTIARGKNKARQEYKSRASMGGTLAGSPNFTGPKAAANYFNNLRNEQAQRLQGLIDEWTTYSNNEGLPEGAVDMINTAIGQTNLLLSKKMMQFKQLIDNCANQDTDPLVNSTDLHGYWDVVTIQIDSLDKRYENLLRMKNNDWEEILPIPKRKQDEDVAPRPKKKVAVKKKAEGSSKLKGAIRLARQRKQLASTEGGNSFDGIFFSIQSPKKSPAKPRKSLLKSVLTSTKDTPRQSPGLTMIKVAQNVKSIKKEPQHSDSEVPGGKSTGKKLKTVLFADEVMDMDKSSGDDKENNEISNKFDTPRSKRQSMRLSSRSKLF